MVLVQQQLGVSERRACRVLGQNRATQRRKLKVGEDEEALREDVVRLARRFGRYGYRMITGMLKIAHLCEASGIKIVSHHGASPIMNLANLHCLCSISNADFIEVLVPEKEYEHGLKTHIRVDEDGYVSVPKEPGLGADIDWDFIDAHTTSRM